MQKIELEKYSKIRDIKSFKDAEDVMNKLINVHYVETDDIAFARRAFGTANGKGKKLQSKFHMLRTAVLCVRIDEKKDDPEEVLWEKKVSLAEKYKCYPVEEKSDLDGLPGTISNMPGFLALDLEEIPEVFGWHNEFFHRDPIHFGVVHMWKQLLRESKGTQKVISAKFKRELAGLIQNLFMNFEQYSESTKKAYQEWHESNYKSEVKKPSDDAYISGLLHLYRRAGGKEDLPQILIDRIDAFADYFPEEILEEVDKGIENLEYKEVIRDPDVMEKKNPLRNIKEELLTLDDNLKILEGTKIWKATMAKWDEEGRDYEEELEGKMGQVPIGDIEYHNGVQRKLDPKHCSKIADPKTFNPSLMEVVRCIKTSEGRFVSIDGQHTTTLLAGILRHLAKKKNKKNIKLAK